MHDKIDISVAEPEKEACDSRVSRKEFLTKLMRRATLAGALLAAPKVVDTFLVPPAYARTSTVHNSDNPHTLPINDRGNGSGNGGGSSGSGSGSSGGTVGPHDRTRPIVDNPPPAGGIRGSRNFPKKNSDPGNVDDFG